MYRKLKNAYYNGWRAGMSDPVLYVVNGHKYVSQPQCPHTGTWQVLQRLVWRAGEHIGTVRRLSIHKARRRAF